ncbi:MAG: glycoside hydrolase family 2 TIM barrel-domain containing protein [Bacteroidales bacterium]
MKNNYFYTIFLLLALFALSLQAQESISLNGKWLMGEKRSYKSEVIVPGIHCDPTKMNNDTLWYKREVVLPKGKWTYATLELKGARFAPEVFVDGISVSRANGGMAPTFHLLKSNKVKPGKSMTLEVALTSLKKLPKTDASYIPATDHWRSNISSSLWDDIVIHLHGEQRIGTVIPNAAPASKTLRIDFYVENAVQPKTDGGDYSFNITDSKGNILLKQSGKYSVGKNTVTFNYNGKLKEWSPENPTLYSMNITIEQNGKPVDKTSRRLGVRKFEIKDKQLYLNGNLFKFRGSSVTWHRWMRTEDGPKLGYDTAWFNKNVVLRLKHHGANSVNFHLGPPPSRLLDLCDQYGILVRYEWNFFHGMPATKESCVEQYGSWMASSMNHPSVNMYYPYNETDGKELQTAWSALDEVLKIYPPLVFSHRDIIHLHKYWWSLFENLGLSYDSYNQFSQTVIADEFGGNYLNANGDEGGYPAVKETYLRFLGRNHTTEMRFKHLELSNGKIAEYWRRIGVAGWTPFTVLGSNEDGNNWFLGDLKEGIPMSVWNSLTSSWSPLAVSLEIWDKNFVPGQKLTVPVYFFNDFSSTQTLKTKITLTDAQGKKYIEQYLEKEVSASSQTTENVTLTMPEQIADYTLTAELINRPAGVKYPVISAWDLRTFRATVPTKVASAKIYTPDDETELKSFIGNYGLQKANLPAEADIIMLSVNSWNKIASGDTGIKNMIETAVNTGKSIVMLDAGPRSLGRGYPQKEGVLVPMDLTAAIKKPALIDNPLFGSIFLRFKEAAEAETHIFPGINDNSLWNNLPKSYAGMWNGLRGNLMVPAWEMDVQGVNADLFLAQWLTRGANNATITSGKPYYAYELHGYYEFSEKADDAETQKRLRNKVLQHIEDAPSLAVFINPNIPIKSSDLASGYKNANTGMAKSLIVMANAGKNLTKTPVMMIEFGDGKGNLLISQLLTADRLTPCTTTVKLYDIRYDETAVQAVLNMMDKIIISE